MALPVEKCEDCGETKDTPFVKKGVPVCLDCVIADDDDCVLFLNDSTTRILESVATAGVPNESP